MKEISAKDIMSFHLPSAMAPISVTDYFTTIITSLNDNLEQLCADTRSRFLFSMFKAVEDPTKPFSLISEITRDGAHFNFGGYELLGRTIVNELQQMNVEPGSRVLLVGDSITAGYPEYEPLLLGLNYGDEQHSFGYYIRTELGCDVVNCGISGDLTSSMASRLSTHLQVEPDLVILQGGANDAYYSMEMRTGIVTEEMAENIVGSILGNFEAMIQECRGEGVRCAVMPLLPFYGEFLMGE